MAGFMELVFWQEMGADYVVPGEGEQFLPLSIGVANDYSRQGERRNAWWAQYTAPGYMDQTDPVYGDTAVEALEECFAMYGDDTDPEERAEYAACLWEARKLRRKGA